MNQFSFPKAFVRQKVLDVAAVTFEGDVVGVAKVLGQDLNLDGVGGEVVGHVVPTFGVDEASNS